MIWAVFDTTTRRERIAQYVEAGTNIRERNLGVAVETVYWRFSMVQ